jgi:hypothetical protein
MITRSLADFGQVVAPPELSPRRLRRIVYG